jgi:hypothetical protein
MKYEIMPTTRAKCWNCKRNNLTHVLPEVRLMKCACGALLPGESVEEYEERKGKGTAFLREVAAD